MLPQKVAVNRLILQLKETGLLRKMIQRNEGNKHRPDCKGANSKPGLKEVGLNHVYGAFALTIFGYIFSIVLWGLEKVTAKWLE